jgi:hypothetical protein
MFGILLIVSFMLWDGSRVKQIENNIESVKEQKKINVVRAARNIKVGELADIVKFEVVEVPRELVPTGAVTSMQNVRNKRVANAISEKEILLQSDLVDSSAWYEDGDRLIEHTFQDGAIPLTVEVGSIVDIKLFKVKDEDCVVVSKAVVIGKVDKTLSFYMDEIEQEYIKEANTEGVLFLAQYLDKSQQGSMITYIPEYDRELTSSKFADSNMKKK